MIITKIFLIPNGNVTAVEARCNRHCRPVPASPSLAPKECLLSGENARASAQLGISSLCRRNTNSSGTAPAALGTLMIPTAIFYQVQIFQLNNQWNHVSWPSAAHNTCLNCFVCRYQRTVAACAPNRVNSTTKKQQTSCILFSEECASSAKQQPPYNNFQRKWQHKQRVQLVSHHPWNDFNSHFNHLLTGNGRGAAKVVPRLLIDKMESCVCELRVYIVSCTDARPAFATCTLFSRVSQQPIQSNISFKMSSTATEPRHRRHQRRLTTSSTAGPTMTQ